MNKTVFINPATGLNHEAVLSRHQGAAALTLRVVVNGGKQETEVFLNKSRTFKKLTPKAAELLAEIFGSETLQFLTEKSNLLEK